MKRSMKVTLVAGTALAVLVPAAAVSAGLWAEGNGNGNGQGNGQGNGNGNGQGNGNGNGQGNGMGNGSGRTNGTRGNGDGTCIDGSGAGTSWTGGRMGGTNGGTASRGPRGDGVEIVQAQLDTIAPSTLTDAEVAGLVQMHEEERLAHDVYTALGTTWDVMVFDRIASAEATHMESIELLLDRYGIDDPSVGLGAGEFADPEVQALYDSLVAQGSTSLTDAYLVGAAIEDLDIGDLRDHATDAADIALVYDHLEQGSRNHLRAFARQLDGVSATYTPTHLTQAEYDSIVDSAVERGPIG